MSLATLFGRGGCSDDTGSDSDPDVVPAPVSATGLNMIPTHTESDIHEPCIVESGHPISTIHGHGDAALEAPPISESVSGVDHTIDDVGDEDEAADDGSDDDDGGGSKPSKHWKNDNYGRPIDRVWLQTLPEQVLREPAYRSVYMFRRQSILYIICCSRHVFELGRVYPNSNPSAMRSHHMRYRQHDIAICRMPV